MTTRPERTAPCEDYEALLAAGSPNAARAASRLLSGRAERELQYAREMAAEDTIFVDAC